MCVTALPLTIVFIGVRFGRSVEHTNTPVKSGRGLAAFIITIIIINVREVSSIPQEHTDGSGCPGNDRQCAPRGPRFLIINYDRQLSYDRPLRCGHTAAVRVG
uniref:Putative secreted protein n=1 Tax=Anopheles darlingi TaxID=43151 RepID=A0A2M4D970_ANODA